MEMEVSAYSWLEAAMEVPVTSPLGPMGPLLRQLHSLTNLPEGVSAAEIENLKEELKGLCISLMDLSEVEHPSFTAKCWMKEMRDLLYDTKDYFDEVIHSSATGGSRTELEMLVARAQNASETRDSYKLDPRAFDKPKFPSPGGTRLPAAFHADLITDHGLMDELTNLLDIDKEIQSRVVSIVGPEGVGKTTLARRLYHKIGVKFQCRAFLKVSPNPDMRRLLTGLFVQLQRQQPSCTWDAQDLTDNIAEYLRDKRYLIIVDDLWTTSVWDIISCAFPNVDCHSRIITTTQIEDVALACCSYQSEYIFKMEPLNDGQSKKLFFNRVFGSEEGCPSDFKEISHEIISKCGGLPLATISIASLLSTESNLKHWEHIKHFLSSLHLKTNPTSGAMKLVGNLIFNNLPPHLKTCLLYLNMYPDDYILRKDEFANQLVAEGFVSAKDGEDTDLVVRGYFDELVGRGMIQPVDTNYNGEVLSCTVHHMVLDLISYKSMEENFITIVDYFQSNIGLVDKVRRLAVQFSGARSADIPSSIIVSKVQSLVFFGFYECVPSIADYKLLQVLILHIWADKEKIFDLTRIHELFRLRYLKIACNITVNMPDEIKGLRCLETLEIDATVTAMPSDIGHLKKLLHFRFPSEVNLPHGFGNLVSLRSLGYFNLGKNSPLSVVMELSNLRNLRDLYLTCSTAPSEILVVKMEHLGSVLGNFNNLQCLILDTGESRMGISCDGLSSVSSAPAHLQRLEFLPWTCIFTSPPKWFQELSKLCVLKIAVRCLSREDIHMLKALPALTVLSLYVWITPASRIVFDCTGFSVLRYFKFMCTTPCVEFLEGAMPSVQKLKLGFNANGMEQYSLVAAGLEHLTGLKEITAIIGVAGADESDRRSAELAVSGAIAKHPSILRVTVQCVYKTFDGEENKINVTQEQEYLTLEKQHEIQEGRVPYVNCEKRTRICYGEDKSTVTQEQGQLTQQHEIQEQAALYVNPGTSTHIFHSEEDKSTVSQEQGRLNVEKHLEVQQQGFLYANPDKTTQIFHGEEDKSTVTKEHGYLTLEKLHEHDIQEKSVTYENSGKRTRICLGDEDNSTVSAPRHRALEKQHETLEHTKDNAEHSEEHLKKVAVLDGAAHKVGCGVNMLTMHDRYELVRDIGSGSHGVARLMRDRLTMELVAVKYIKRGSEMDANVQREIINHRALKHPNIIRFKEVILTPTHVAIVMEYASGGELFERVHKNTRFGEDEARYFFQQLISGVGYCHSMEVCHRDLKLANTLLDGSPAPRLKICDFGYSKSSVLHSQPKSAVGTPAYIAPEVLLKKEYDGKIADIWSCGVILYTMVVGAYPFEDPEEPKNFRKTIQHILNIEYSVPDKLCISPECKHLISKIFVKDPAMRITIPEIRNHSWFLKNLPADLMDVDDMSCQNDEPNQPMQTIDQIMGILTEATIPHDLCMKETPTDGLDLDDEIHPDSDLDIDSSGEIVSAM
ncbi:hypothetical protein ACQJBY_048090 [Aegilops geniculata]